MDVFWNNTMHCIKGMRNYNCEVFPHYGIGRIFKSIYQPIICSCSCKKSNILFSSCSRSNQSSIPSQETINTNRPFYGLVKCIRGGIGEDFFPLSYLAQCGGCLKRGLTQEGGGLMAWLCIGQAIRGCCSALGCDCSCSPWAWWQPFLQQQL